MARNQTSSKSPWLFLRNRSGASPVVLGSCAVLWIAEGISTFHLVTNCWRMCSRCVPSVCLLMYLLGSYWPFPFLSKQDAILEADTEFWISVCCEFSVQHQVQSLMLILQYLEKLPEEKEGKHGSGVGYHLIWELRRSRKNEAVLGT